MVDGWIRGNEIAIESRYTVPDLVKFLIVRKFFVDLACWGIVTQMRNTNRITYSRCEGLDHLDEHLLQFA